MKRTWCFLFLLVAGLSACQKQRAKKTRVDWTLYRKAYAFLTVNTDSAFYYFNRSATSSADSLQIAMAYSNMAMIQSDAGDYFGAQESLIQSLKLLNDRNPKHLACLTNDYNELGMNSASLKMQNDALSFYNKALGAAPDSTLRDAILGNKAFAFEENGDYRAAINIYQLLLAKKDVKKSSYARRLTNLAQTKWLADRRYNAAPELLKALGIRQKNNDQWGMNSSYINLARYYHERRPDSAYFYASKMYRVATTLNSPDDRLEALDILIKAGPSSLVKNYFSTYRKLIDSVQTKRNAAKNQFALIRYNVEKQKANNLVLQKDNAEKRYQIGKQQVLLYLALIILLGGIGGGSYWYRKRKLRAELEALTRIRENELRTSKKVHDVVANGIYGIMSEIEHQDELDKEQLLDKMEVLYERSRDISYEPALPDYRNFHQKIADLLLSYATVTTKVVLAGNEDGFWKHTASQVKYELEHILLELMVNMKKHSQASNVVVKFEEQADRLRIYYMDDGVGMSEFVFFKNGLTNTGNRIKAIGGEIIFERPTEKGLHIQLSFPKV